MPNHVTTRCTITGPADEIARFRSTMIGTDRNGREEWTLLDFRKAVPMPPSIEATDGDGITDEVLPVLLRVGDVLAAWERLRKWDHKGLMGRWKGLFGFERGEIELRLEAAFPGCIAKARAAALAYGETGYKNWYDWSIANWGTKWNSYSFSIEAEAPLVLEFDTAWAFPEPVFKKIAGMFPALRFDCICFAEGWNFAGEGSFNGEPPFVTSKELATDELYERVYGRKPERDDDDEDAAESASPN